MFDNTYTYNFNSADRVLVRVNQDKYTSEYLYRSSDVRLQLFIRHTSAKAAGAKYRRDRHNVEFLITTYRTDGTPSIRKAYLVFEHDEDLMANHADDTAQFLTGFLTESNLAKLVAWES